MGQNQPPEWWIKQRGGRIGCADVTIVSFACIAAFVILFLIIVRADFVGPVNSLPFFRNSTAVAATATPGTAVQSGTSTALAQAGSYYPGTPLSANSTTAPAAGTTPPAINITATKRATVTATSLNLRRDPSATNDNVIATLHQHSVLKLLGDDHTDDNNDTWVHVETDDGKTGWVQLRYLEPITQ